MIDENMRVINMSSPILQLSSYQKKGSEDLIKDIWPNISYIPSKNECRIQIEFKIDGIDNNLREFVVNSMNKHSSFDVSNSMYGNASITMSKHVSERYLTEKSLQEGVDKYVLSSVKKAFDLYEESIKVHMADKAIISPFSQGGSRAKSNFLSSIMGYAGLKM
jgi:hypothetical protein